MTNESEGGQERKLLGAAEVARRIAEHFRARAEEDGRSVVRVRDTLDDPEGLMKKLFEVARAHNADPLGPGGPIVVEIVGEEPYKRKISARRRSRRAASPVGDPARSEAKAVREAAKAWIEYGKVVERTEADAERDPVGTLYYVVNLARNQIAEARQVLYEQFGVGFDVGGLFGPRRMVVVDEQRFQLDDREEVVELCNAIWRCMTFDDVRVHINAVVTDAERRGESLHLAAPAACKALVHVLRSRPMLYAMFLFAPDWMDHEPSGLRKVRAATTTLLAGWVRSQLRLRDWISPNGKIGPNRLRKALEEMAQGGESAEDVLLRELPTLVTVLTKDILQEATADPERALRKLRHTILRNRVATNLTGAVSDEGKLRGKGRHVAENEADAERALLAHQQVATMEASGIVVDSLMAKLSPQQRKIINLVREGKKNPEIATALATSVNNVQKQKSEALRRLREEIKVVDF